MTNQMWAITLGHRAILYIPRHHIAEITKVSKPMHVRRDCVGDLLQVLTYRTLWDMYLCLSVCTVECGLFMWLGDVASAFQAMKSCLFTNEEKAAKEKQNKNESKKQLQEASTEKNGIFGK